MGRAPPEKSRKSIIIKDQERKNGDKNQNKTNYSRNAGIVYAVWFHTI